MTLDPYLEGRVDDLEREIERLKEVVKSEQRKNDKLLAEIYLANEYNQLNISELKSKITEVGKLYFHQL